MRSSVRRPWHPDRRRNCPPNSPCTREWVGHTSSPFASNPMIRSSGSVSSGSGPSGNDQNGRDLFRLRRPLRAEFDFVGKPGYHAGRLTGGSSPGRFPWALVQRGNIDRGSPNTRRIWLAWKTTVKGLGTMVLILLFAVSTIACAFHTPEGAALSSPQGSGFCGVLNASTVNAAIPNQPAPPDSSDAGNHSMTGIYPLWSLAQSIDHPPEQPV